MSGNKKPQEDEEVGEEYKYDDDDFLEVEQLSEPKKEGPYEEKDWENEEESGRLLFLTHFVPQYDSSF